MAGKFWTQDELSYLKDHYKSNPQQISLYLKRTAKSIKNMARRLNIIRTRTPFLDHHYFSILNEENCYWAGFIAADGSLPIARKQMVINLATCDEKHLENFRQCLRFEGQVYYREYNNINYVSILVPSKQIYQDLQTNFNITPQKSLTLCPPILTNEALIRSFIRGYFDGDGCLSNSISFAGTEQFLTWVRKQLTIYTNRSINQRLRKADNIYILEYGGRLQKNLILDWLYQNSNPSTRLGRKYDKRMESVKSVLNTKSSH